MQHHYFKYISQIALLAIVYFFSARLGLSLAFEHAHISPVWPPTGLAIAAILYFGLRVWPGIFVGAMLINLYISSSTSLSLAIAIGNTLEAVIAGYFISRFASSRPFANIQSTVAFIIILSLSTLISATIGVVSLSIAGAVTEQSFWPLWVTWWLGDSVGGLVIAPLLLTWRHFPTSRYSKANLPEAALLLLITLFVMNVVFVNWSFLPDSHDLLIFTSLPLLVWAALRFHHHGATLIGLVMSAGAIIGTLNGHGPFIMPTENESLLLIQASIGAAMITALILMASQKEGLQANHELKQTQKNLENIVLHRTQELKLSNERLKHESLDQKHLTDTLQALLYNSDYSAKEEFFIHSVEALSDAYETRFAMVGIFSDEGKKSIKTLAVWAGGQESENFTYELKGTPCEDVLDHSMSLISKLAAIKYPADEMLLTMGVESYFGAPLKTTAGEVIGIISVMDTKEMYIESWLKPVLGLFSNRVAYELQRRETIDELELAASVFKESIESIIICDAHLVIIRANPAFLNMTGYSLDEVIGKTPRLLKSDHHSHEFYDQFWSSLNTQGIWKGEITNKRKNGERYIAWQIVKAVHDDSGNVQQYIGISNDITEKKLAEDKIYQLAHHDTITQLPNRMSFHQQLTSAIEKAQRSATRMAVMFIDLDHFKLINDSSGHPVGDELLQHVALRLKEIVGSTNLISRFGGDEFTVMLPYIESINTPTELAKKILTSLTEPFYLENNEITISASIGIGLYPDNGCDVSTLLKSADSAMYRAKENGRSSYQFYTEQMNTDAQERVAIEQDLRKAIKMGEFCLHYQPQVDLQDNKVIGVEALIRWKHPSKGLIPPDKFIPIAEATGLIVPIGNWVIYTACQQFKQWRQAGFEHFTVAINLSGRQFLQKDLLSIIEQALNDAEMKASSLEFEITESMMMSNIEETIDTLQKIKELGAQLSIDDFGTGYSSLSYLKKFPLNKLKIDRSFVQGLPNDTDDVAIVEATIAIANALNLTVIAEGVETLEQLDYLKASGCSEVQGFYFSRPLPPEDIPPFLKTMTVI